MEAVAVYSTADRDALHVRLADEAICVGPPAAAESYLRIPSIVAAAVTTGCDAVHPGYGFLAENPAFVEACADNDLVFVGPPPEVMTSMARQDRSAGRDARRRRPDRPGHRRRHLDRRGPERGRRARLSRSCSRRPPAAAARGCGWSRPPTSSRTPSAPPRRRRARRSATRPSTSRRCSRRRATSRSRCSATCDGNVLTLGERECSLQRRHQKLVEETPSPALTPELREAMEDAAERACRAVGYVNAGTLEFLLGPDGSFSFIELNARLQVEHPITEACTGIDLVRAQLHVAAGEPLAAHRARAAAGARDRDPAERRGSGPGLHAGAGNGFSLPAGARARRPDRHVRRGRHRRLALLRLAARQADRLGSRPSGGDRPGRASARGDS